jgi:hypothetical protein
MAVPVKLNAIHRADTVPESIAVAAVLAGA